MSYCELLRATVSTLVERFSPDEHLGELASVLGLVELGEIDLYSVLAVGKTERRYPVVEITVCFGIGHMKRELLGNSVKNIR